MSEIQVPLHSITNTESVARDIAQRCTAGTVIALRGELGTGKTTFARAFIRTLTEPDEEVPSPTFNLVQTYDTDKGTIWHFDLYRLKHLEEAFELGIEDALTDGICLIEWPEIIMDLLPENTLHLQFTYQDEQGERMLTATGNTALVSASSN